MLRNPFAALALLLATLPASGVGFSFNFVGQDGNNLVNVTATGSIAATNGLTVSSIVTQSWSLYGDFWHYPLASEFFSLTPGITLTNENRSATVSVTSLWFDSDPGNDHFGFIVGNSVLSGTGETFTLAGSATFTIGPSFEFTDLFSNSGTFTTGDTLNPFGTGPTLSVTNAAIPESAAFPALLAGLLFFGVLARRFLPFPR